MREAGADIFVAGSSSLFSGEPLADTIRHLRGMIA
jgi:pentose-5-phosphate-3-epimerase